MKRAILVLALGYVILIFQTTWGQVFQTGPVRIDGLCALLTWYGLKASLPGGLVTAVLLGGLSEAFSILPGGIYILALSLGYLFVRYILSHTLSLTPIWQQMLVCAFVSIAIETVLLIGGQAMDLLWPYGFAQAILNGLTYPFWFQLLESSESLAKRVEARTSVIRR